MLKLKEDKRTYTEAINTLDNRLREKEAALKDEIPLLENKLAASEKQRYEAIKKNGELTEQVDYLLTHNSELCDEAQQLLDEKQTIKHELEEVMALLHEAEERSQKLDMVEANYEHVCEELHEVSEELEREQDTSKHMYNMFQDQIRRNQNRYCCALCPVVIVVLTFGIVIMAFAYCLEDPV